jgi:outer membrane protein OmpA-like peptidoglycan-associated protein
VYEQLKANQNTDFEYRQDFYRVADGYSWARDYKGTMQRDVLAPYTFHTLINGRATDLPALHATGVLGGNPATLTVLDDPANPLLLNFQISTLRFTINIAKISYPIPRALEAQLRDERRADIYGIYFDFDSSGLRSESSPVLAEIADALQQHPDWRLRISGHTDNIGSASRNLELSMQRAQAVKQALEDLHSIQADRLSVDGFGDTRPKSTNATVEGRALNRRVELVRE